MKTEQIKYTIVNGKEVYVLENAYSTFYFYTKNEVIGVVERGISIWDGRDRCMEFKVYAKNEKDAKDCMAFVSTQFNYFYAIIYKTKQIIVDGFDVACFTEFPKYDLREKSKKWIEEDKPCLYKKGSAYSVSYITPISKEKSADMLNKSLQNEFFTDILFTHYNGKEYLQFNAPSAYSDVFTKNY